MIFLVGRVSINNGSGPNSYQNVIMKPKLLYEVSALDMDQETSQVFLVTFLL